MAIPGLIVPPNYFKKLEEFNVSLIYLLGPIKGAPNWHDNAIELIYSYNPNAHVACPSVRLREDYTRGLNLFISRSKGEHDEWEKYHLNRANKKGCILFWFPKEISHKSYKIYAQSATIHLGRISILRRESKIKAAFGIEPGFFGEGDLRGILRMDDPDVKVFSTLEETCKEAAILSG